MPVTTAEAREEILTELGEAADRIALGVSCLSEAFELLDDATAERLEDELFRAVQKAYGRAKRTHSSFAERVQMPARSFEPQPAGSVSQGPKPLIERAVEATTEADRLLAELQDSMLPIEAGDAELRAGLAEVRELVEPVPATAREILRVLGR